MGSNFSGIGGHQSTTGKTDEWLTPPEMVACLGGAESFDLDPCAPLVQPFPTARFTFNRHENGLIQRWFGRVWLNPPYSRPLLGRFMARMAEHNRGIALIFARTDTEIFHRYVFERAHALLFLAGRVNFLTPEGAPSLRPSGTPANSGAPSVLCAYGPRDADVLAFCGVNGKFVPLIIPRSVVVKVVDKTWRELVRSFFQKNPGPVSLDKLCRAFAEHEKAQRNKNYDAKLRQIVQSDEYTRVARGTYELRHV